MARKLLTEFIGTFFLVFVVALTAPTGNNLAPVAIGAILMVMVYMGGHVSGAHYNPAVTLALLVRGRTSPALVVPYWLAQLAGGFSGAFLGEMLLGKSCPVAPGADIEVWHAVLVEVLFTFALALVVLNVATVKDTANNSYYGLAIGFTITAAAYAGGWMSGGAFNPAVGLGANLVAWMNLSEGLPNPLSTAWIHVVGPVVGGVVAGAVFRIQNPEDK